jgi:hypothetical protein
LHASGGGIISSAASRHSPRAEHEKNSRYSRQQVINHIAFKQIWCPLFS